MCITEKGMIMNLSDILFFADSGASVVKYFNDSNFAGQVIVVVLIAFSVVAWAVMFGKYTDLKELKKQNAITEGVIAKAPSVMSCAAESKSLNGPYAVVLREAIAAWNRFGSESMTAELFTLRMQQVENGIQRAISRQYIRYESKMVLLGSVITGAPFLGLLGTVWGVMDCFGSMGNHATVTLQQLAPGVSGALLTTVAGLVVAIPSVFGYNFLLTLSKGMVTDLENFASSLCDKVELETRHKVLQANVANVPARPAQPAPQAYRQQTLPAQPQSQPRPAQAYQPEPPHEAQQPEPPQRGRNFKISFNDGDDSGGRYSD